MAKEECFNQVEEVEPKSHLEMVNQSFDAVGRTTTNNKHP
eukprot:CAMPEP_0184005914 /NCGR_PEP_ID=MMETSP0954-20121128/350_1 /TAXON_ID=627963 /ORGANISM="Aplanochytrium sp, Strain PBS07" /LENGTH=39 /DNA_ID= /DNA_START= /DNA_END= /DNA_ORIENTATION=